MRNAITHPAQREVKMIEGLPYIYTLKIIYT